MTFVCTGRECLDCPLKDCVRELCEREGEFVEVIVKKELKTYEEKLYKKNYYVKNREKMLNRSKERYWRLKGCG